MSATTNPGPRAGVPPPSLARTTLALTSVLIGVYVVLDGLAQLLPPHYNPLSQAESLLAVGPYGYVMTVNFVVRGLFSASFLIGLTRATRIGERSRAGIALFGVWSVGAFLLAIFPADGPGAETTVHGQVHFVVALIAFVGAAAGVLLLSRQFIEEPRLRESASPAILLSVLTILAFVVLILAPDVPFLYEHAYGLVERVFIGLVLVWMLVVSLCLLRSNRMKNQPVSQGP